MNNNYKDFAEKVLLDATEYTGNKEPGKKHFEINREIRISWRTKERLVALFSLYESLDG